MSDEPAFGVVVTDLDRTFTGLDLALDEQALAAARRLRQAGVTCVLATGRRVADLSLQPALEDAFDGFVAEGGAIWGTWGEWRLASPETQEVHAASRALRAAGCPVEDGLASFSISADWAAQLATVGDRLRLSIQPNRDRIDVAPAGIDKGVGLHLLLSHLGRDGERSLAVGDGENDLPLFAASDHSVAVANAAPLLQAGADEVAPHAAAQGFLWAVAPLLPPADVSPGLAGGAP